MSAQINTVACPRCGCWLKKEFDCNCGQVHDDYCGNCGRWVSLPPTEHVELSNFNDPCTAGPVMHEHRPLTEDEFKRRWRAKVKAYGGEKS